MQGASNFGAPQSAEFDEQQHMSGGEQGHDQGVEIEIDPNDPFLNSTAESMETDAAHDAYAQRPPMPDAKWRAKVRIAKIKNKKGEEVPENYIAAMSTWLDKNVPYYAMNLEFEIIDPTNHYDGFKMTEYHVKTLVNAKIGGSSPLATLVRKSGGVVPTGSSQAQVRDIALAHFAGEPELMLESQWIATCQFCEEKAKKAIPKEKAPRPLKRGQRAFPPKVGVAANAFVKNDPLVECPTCHTTNRAKATPVQYFTVKEATPTFINRG